MPTWIGRCCRDWIMALGFPAGRCGLCGEKPVFVEYGPTVGESP